MGYNVTKMENVFALDIGGSKIVLALVSPEGKILRIEKEELPPFYGVEVVKKTIRKLHHLFPNENVSSIGSTVPALADHKKGIWLYSPFNKIRDFPLGDFLTEEFSVPSFVDNDVNACAIGEKRFGACQKEDDFLWVTVSNGIGGALFLKGELYRGKNGNAGEIGHMRMDFSSDAPFCGCGHQGCLEATSSGRGISARYATLTGKQLEANEIASLARQGEEKAKEAVAYSATLLGRAISYVVNLLNLPLVILGGGVSQSFDLLKPYLLKEIRQGVWQEAAPKVVLKTTSLGYYAATVGAATLALEGIKK